MENDNGQAAYALQPYNSNVSGEISQTLNHYESTFQFPNETFSQVFWGVPIAGPALNNNTNVFVNVSSTFSILTELHNGAGVLNYSHYGNTLVLHSINEYLKGNVTGSLKDFYAALAMWNGTGIVDGAIKGDKAFLDYKLA